MDYADIPDENCPICLESFKNVPIVKQKCCGKQMHIKCFVKWYEKYQKNCPMCRHAFDEEQSDNQMETQHDLIHEFDEEQPENQIETQHQEQQDLIPVYNRNSRSLITRRNQQYMLCKGFCIFIPIICIIIFFGLHDELIVKNYDIYNTTYGRNMFTNN